MQTEPIYRDGRLIGFNVTRYRPMVVTPQNPPPRAPQRSPVTLAAIQTLLTTALDARDQALEGRLAVYSQQAAERTERLHLAGQLATQGFTAQDCAGMSLAALRKVGDAVARAEDDALPEDVPSWR